jgi:hypothetical protein
MKKFPSIEQFRNVIHHIRENHDFKGKDEAGTAIRIHTSPYPTITFSGTVKLHGTNAGIVLYKDEHIEYQSRENVLGEGKDNAGFMTTMKTKNLGFLFEDIEFQDYIAVYGEWVGKGIQSGVAVSELPKMFVIFAIDVDGEWRTDLFMRDPDQGIYFISDFDQYYLTIDFNSPELVQNRLVEITNAVEAECPVGKFFGVSGVGEGVVWAAKHEGVTYRFKVKGEKHSVSKVKTLASVDVEAVRDAQEFVSNVLTDARLEQGIQYLKETGAQIDQTSTGTFLRWVIGDVIKEEGDTIRENTLDQKKIGAATSKKAREWFFNYLNSNL